MDVLVVVDNFIAGTMLPCRRLLDSIEPGTGAVWAKVPDSGKLEVDAAVVAAKRAFAKWSKLTGHERATCLLKAADLLESRLEDFAEAESRDQGKPVHLARTYDVPRAIFNLRHAAHALPHLLTTSTVQAEAGVVSYVLREPAGVVGIICPWTVPLCGFVNRLAPAIMCGNTVVAKPSLLTSVTAFMFCKILQDAGFPAGVVNVVFGSGPSAGELLASHPDLPLLTFGGTTIMSKRIVQTAAPLLKKVSVKAGGNNAAVVFSDCDLERCVATLRRNSFINQGETRLCTSRIFVEESLHDEFLSTFVDAVRELRVGPPSDEGFFMGAIVSKTQLEKIREYINSALEERGTVLCGEGIDVCYVPDANKNGFFMRPTVISGLQADSRCLKEEIAGPVVCVVPFSTEAEAVSLVNKTCLSQGASIWTSNLVVAHRLAHRLKVRKVWTNCWSSSELDAPSEMETDSGKAALAARDDLEFFTLPKTVTTMVLHEEEGEELDFY
ncbi:hypothetical protein OTU49_015562 [Cherax quadricarinatus]|uniref:Aldehyde dehydrogenase domain-containing protein n=2 Tax=Cherax quadricarinatus TaxID=27406 RepID=A0AAW0Y1C2_CHEQU